MDDSSRQKHVLVVDDDSTMRELICRTLKRMQIGTVEEAESGERALTRLQGQRADLVICDWDMAGMSGLELFQAMAATGASMPFLMLTGRGDVESIIAAKSAGIPAYILKPVTSQELKQKVLFLLGEQA
jgi:DNA-binding NtrC family response regulator